MANIEKLFTSRLAKDEQEHLKHCVKELQTWLRMCERRLGHYEAENAEAAGQSVLKLIQELQETRVMIDEMMKELLEKHRLPDDLRIISEEFRQGVRSVLIGDPATEAPANSRKPKGP